MQAARGSKRKSRKAALVLGAAGVSLAMGGGASATAPATNVPSQDNARRIVLGEEEVSDVSLATFYVFDKENTPPFRHGLRLAAGGCGGHGGGGGCGGHGGGGGCGGHGGCATHVGCAGGCAAHGGCRCAGHGCRGCRGRLRWCIYRRSLLGLRRRLRNLLAIGPLPRPVDQRLLLTKYDAELAGNSGREPLPLPPVPRLGAPPSCGQRGSLFGRHALCRTRVPHWNTTRVLHHRVGRLIGREWCRLCDPTVHPADLAASTLHPCTR